MKKQITIGALVLCSAAATATAVVATQTSAPQKSQLNKQSNFISSGAELANGYTGIPSLKTTSEVNLDVLKGDFAELASSRVNKALTIDPKHKRVREHKIDLLRFLNSLIEDIQKAKTNEELTRIIDEKWTSGRLGEMADKVVEANRTLTEMDKYVKKLPSTVKATFLGDETRSKVILIGNTFYEYSGKDLYTIPKASEEWKQDVLVSFNKDTREYTYKVRVKKGTITRKKEIKVDWGVRADMAFSEAKQLEMLKRNALIILKKALREAHTSSDVVELEVFKKISEYRKLRKEMFNKVENAKEINQLLRMLSNSSKLKKCIELFKELRG